MFHRIYQWVVLIIYNQKNRNHKIIIMEFGAGKFVTTTRNYSENIFLNSKYKYIKYIY